MTRIILKNGRVIPSMKEEYREAVKQGINLLNTSRTRNYIDPIKLQVNDNKRKVIKESARPDISGKFSGRGGDNPFLKLYNYVNMAKEDNEYCEVKLE